MMKCNISTATVILYLLITYCPLRREASIKRAERLN